MVVSIERLLREMTFTKKKVCFYYTMGHFPEFQVKAAYYFKILNGETQYYSMTRTRFWGTEQFEQSEIQVSTENITVKTLKP